MKKQNSHVVTEEILEKKLGSEFALFRIEMDGKFDNLDEKNRGYRDQILTGLDGVMKELQDMREENAASTLHFERNDETLENHEKRITTLEHSKN